MKPSVRAWPFESKYLRDFAVVEERCGNLRLFPATEQLPLLSQAINKEFESGLTTRLRTTDGRAEPLRKYVLHVAAGAFCSLANGARPDHLHVWPYYTPELVSQIAIVQHISESSPGGLRHWFRQFRGTDFLPDIYLSGKRVVFSSHAIDRYSERSQVLQSHPAMSLTAEFFAGVITVLQLNGDGPAFAFPSGGTVAVQPFEETADEFFVLTTLGPNEVHLLDPLVPPRSVHLHYGPACTPQGTGAAVLHRQIEQLLGYWRTQTPCYDFTDRKGPRIEDQTWTRMVQFIRATNGCQDDPANAVPLFYDGVHGPSVITPNYPEPRPEP